MTKHFFNPPGVRPPFGNYHHGAQISTEGSAIWLASSGQLGITEDDEVPESPLAQATLCFEALQQILAGADMNFSHVIRLTAYVTDREYFKDYMSVRDQYVKDPAPASTLLIVSGFTRPEFKVEVELLAVK